MTGDDENSDTQSAAPEPTGTAPGEGSIEQKLDTVAGAVAATHADLLAHVAEVEARRARDAAALQAQIAGLETLVERQRHDLASALGARLTGHTDLALAGLLRLLDARLATLREAITDGVSEPAVGFEAGAVLGATQAAWHRLEQRLDHEFDDLGRQLQAMAALIDQAVTTAEAAANRPVVSGDQLRRAATSVKDTVVSASRSRRARRGGPRGLGPGGDPGRYPGGSTGG